jgi:sucrose phosphorylase
MLALRGVPAVYVHSLLGTPNYDEGVRESGQPRRINRRKYGRSELDEILVDRNGTQSHVFAGYQQLLAARVVQAAFHPDAAQQVVDSGDASLLTFLRTSLDGHQQILVAANVSGEPRCLPNRVASPDAIVRDLITREAPSLRGNEIQLQPYQTVWLEMGE